MEHLQEVKLLIKPNSDIELRDCTVGREYTAQYIAVGECDRHGLMRVCPAYEPCYQFFDDVGDNVALIKADCFLGIEILPE